MAYLEARSDIARSGVTHAGLFAPQFQALIGGADLTDDILLDDFTVTLKSGGAQGEAEFSLRNQAPVEGQTVVLAEGTPNAYLFAGTLMRPAIDEVQDGAPVLHRCVVTDLRWFLNRFARVHARYTNMGANVVVGTILSSFTNGGFRVGYIPSSLGNVTVEYDGETVSEAIDRVVAIVGGDAVWELDPFHLTVSIFTTPPDGNTRTLTDSTRQFAVSHEPDLSQVRTRTRVRGEGSTATAVVAAGATSIPVEDTRPFVATPGGSAMAAGVLFTYTGKSVASGPGSLTGVSGLTIPIDQGASVHVAAQAEDAAAQAALATLLGGGGISGVVTFFIDDGSLTASEVAAVAAADVAAFKDPSASIGYSIIHRFHRPNRDLTVNITAPVTINDTYFIKQVTLKGFTRVKAGDVRFFRRVEAETVRKRFAPIVVSEPPFVRRQV